MAKFDELMIHYDLCEDPWLIFSRFRNDLRYEIRKSLMYHTMDTIESTSYKVQETKHDLNVTT